MVRAIMWLMRLPQCWLLLSWAGLVLVCHSHSTGSGWWWVRVTSLMVRLQPNWVQGLVTALPQLELSAANCGQAAAVTYYTPHLPAPTTTQIPTTNPTYIIQLKIYTPLTVTIDCPRLAGLRIIESCQVLGPPALSGSFECWDGDCLSSPRTQGSLLSATTPPAAPHPPAPSSPHSHTMSGHFLTNPLSFYCYK